MKWIDEEGGWGWIIRVGRGGVGRVVKIGEGMVVDALYAGGTEVLGWKRVLRVQEFAFYFFDRSIALDTLGGEKFHILTA